MPHFDSNSSVVYFSGSPESRHSTRLCLQQASSGEGGFDEGDFGGGEGEEAIDDAVDLGFEGRKRGGVLLARRLRAGFREVGEAGFVADFSGRDGKLLNEYNTWFPESVLKWREVEWKDKAYDARVKNCCQRCVGDEIGIHELRAAGFVGKELLGKGGLTRPVRPCDHELSLAISGYF